MPVTYLYNDLTHGAMQNLHTGDFIQFMLNPTQLRRQLKVSYGRVATRAGSHQWLQYRYTGNVVFTLDLVFSRYVYMSLERSGRPFGPSEYKYIQDDFEDGQRFLLEACYPRGEATDVVRRSPPQMLLLWPRHIAVVCVVTSLGIMDDLFDADQRVVGYTVNVTLEEHRTYRLTGAEVRRQGMKRAKPRV